MELTKDTLIHGFRVRYAQDLPELKATLYRMEYEKNGADLVWLDRPDDNKTFSIAFKTIPSDDTGVFHILEHSVLCGSRKYPVREPFVELLKSSLQTFLNAMTFPDKTMYPVSSRNDKDFLNLVDVYMDAVLHPLSAESPLGFRQEGWHYELGEDGRLTRNGVVFNEMKGAYADPDSVLHFELGRRLYPDNCYGYESGGHPEHIKELTYESYLANHARFYHPSNSYIFLDGEVDLDAVLAKLDSFLRDYDRIDVDADIPFQAPVRAPEATAQYEYGAPDSGENKVLVGRGWIYGRYDRPELSFAASILARALCSTNESPLKKAILDEGLAEDVSLYNSDGTLQHGLCLNVHNTSEEKKDRLLQVVDRVLEEQSRGLDHRELHAILNQVEFANREKDYGRMPRGLVFAITAMESWLYGGDPAQNLDLSGLFESLRKKIDEGWFEKLLREITLDNPHTATVVLLPSKTLGEETRARDEAELAGIRAGWSEAELDRVREEFAELRRHQSEADTPEALATLPVLSIEDIPEKMAPLPYSDTEFMGRPLLVTDVETGGIIYLSLNLAAGDLSREEIKLLPSLCALVGSMPTAEHSALEIATLVRENIGRLGFSAAAAPRLDGGVTPYLEVSLALLPEKAERALEIVREMLFTVKLEDSPAVLNVLRQNRIMAEQNAINAGNAIAATRAASALTADAALDDDMSGIGQIRFLQRAEREFETEGEGFIARVYALRDKLLARGRLTVSVAGKAEESLLAGAVEMFPEGEPGESVDYTPEDRDAEGFSIPAGIGFAGRAAKLADAGAEYSGSMAVAFQFLSLDYLWNTVRVKGGAYGVGMGATPFGTVRATSFRDPNCAATLDAFNECGRVLRSFVESGESLDRFIISTIGGMEPIMTPRQELRRHNGMYFSGRTPEMLQRVRSQVLHTTREDIAAFADTLDALAPGARVCVVAGEPVLDACGDKIASRESIQ